MLPCSASLVTLTLTIVTLMVFNSLLGLQIPPSLSPNPLPFKSPHCGLTSVWRLPPSLPLSLPTTLILSCYMCTTDLFSIHSTSTMAINCFVPIMQGLLTIMTSSTVEVHGGTVLQAVRYDNKLQGHGEI